MADIGTTVQADDVPDLLGALILLIAPVRTARAEPQQRLVGDLGYHSLALAELGFTIEDLFRVESLSPETAMSIERVEDVVKLVVHHVTEGEGYLPDAGEVEAVFARYGSTWPLNS